jgi:hypothetical protein
MSESVYPFENPEYNSYRDQYDRLIDGIALQHERAQLQADFGPETSGQTTAVQHGADLAMGILGVLRDGEDPATYVHVIRFANDELHTMPAMSDVALHYATGIPLEEITAKPVDLPPVIRIPHAGENPELLFESRDIFIGSDKEPFIYENRIFSPDGSGMVAYWVMYPSILPPAATQE